MKAVTVTLSNNTDKLRITSHPNPDSYDITISTNPYISIYLEDITRDNLKEIGKFFLEAAEEGYQEYGN
jgi:hypothetical protein